MKRICIVLMLTLLTACAPENTDGGGVKVVATFYPVYLAAANIAEGAEGVEVSLLTQPAAGCLHEYQLSPGELKTAQAADIVLASGTESFLERIDANVRDCGGGKGEHFWVLPENFIDMAAEIRDCLIEADPENTELYTRNCDAYGAELSELAGDMRAGTAALNDAPVIAMHEAFELWKDAYGLDIAAVIEREPGTEPTPRELSDIINLAEELGISALFAEPQYSDASAQAIARETGAKVYMLDPVASGPLELDYYQTAQRENLETLRLALGEK